MRTKRALVEDASIYVYLGKKGVGGVGGGVEGDRWGGLRFLLYASRYLLRLLYVCAFRTSTSDLGESALPEWALGLRVEFVFRDWGAGNSICKRK